MAKQNNTFILGAIVGDIIGSTYEFNNVKTSDFDLLPSDSTYTDDTVMTLAVAKWLCEDSEHKHETLIKIMQQLGRKHTHRGYGGHFREWIYSDSPEPYNSWGNGSGMRVSPVAYVASSLEECLELAKITAEVTHNHPEGIKGAQAIASAAYLYRQGKSKEEIKAYITDTFAYNLDFTLDSIRPRYYFDVSCQGSAPQAIVAFLEGNTFEEVARLAVSIGGDSDTIAAMACSIAAAGAMDIDAELSLKCRDLLKSDLIQILDTFDSLVKGEITPGNKKVKPRRTKKNDAIEIGTSKELYNYLLEACNILRGPISQDAFKEYITPLLYFKRISDVYDEETAQALEESKRLLGTEEGDLEYAHFPEQHRFVIPEGCHWNDIRERNENLGSAIVGAMRKIELANPSTLYGVLSVFSTAKWANKNVFSDDLLRKLIEHMSTRSLGNNDYNADLMGDAYEMLLKKFADLTKAKAGEFYTPRSVVSLLIRILNPQPGETVYDPACGSGGMLMEAVHHMKNDNKCCGAIFGQEKNVVNASVAKMNLFLHGANDFNIMCGDTLRDPKILQNEHIAHFDCVVANPPFSLKDWGSEAWKTDRFGRNIWGTPSDSCGDYAWLQHMVCSMRSLTGRMAVVLPQGVLFRGAESVFREALIKRDYIDAIFTLGDNVFYGTNLSPCFLIIRDRKPVERRNKVLMVDGSKVLTLKSAQNILSDDDVNRLYQFYVDYTTQEDYSAVVSTEDIAGKGYDLSPNAYVTYHKEAIKPYAEVKAEFLQAYQRMLDAEALFRNLMNEPSL